MDERPVMRAEIRALHSPDLLEIKTGSPKDPEDFAILVQALVGPKGETGKESFDFMVCTPKRLEQQLSNQDYMFGRHMIVVRSYSFELIWSAINGLCERTFGSTWKEVAEKLGRYGQWEFEDYQEYRG